jgi:CheY-like chemotaxis protein/two-component sensor histidine kinase
METVGSLAGGIAHDFNNLLMGILACSRIAREERVDGEQARELFEEIGAAASRGIALTRRLLAFSRRQAVQLRPTSLNAVIRENETMLRQLLGEDVDLRIELDLSGAHALADEGLIEQVLINLVVNARDAMPAGGEIAVRTRDLADPPRVLLEIRDTGMGMTPEVRERIFEPFFTTKGPDKGTGLGLSTVKRIVEELQGTIEVETEPGRGTTFRLGMPRSSSAQLPTPIPPPMPVSAQKCSVLVVEDDHLVRASLRRYLDKRGYAVLVADGPAQALDLAGRSSFDVLVTDMIMPGATGSELARKIRQLRPACKVVFMSAHPAEVLIEQGRLEPGAAFLEKPFEMTTLDGLLGQVLGAPRSGSTTS